MAHAVSARERLEQVLFDTIGMQQDDVPPHVAHWPGMPSYIRLFNGGSGDGNYSNVVHGSMPANVSFKILGLGLRLNLKGPVADDMCSLLLQSLRIELQCGDKSMLGLPPGTFVPPGLGTSIEAVLRNAAALDFDEQPSLWANHTAAVLGGEPVIFFPSDQGYPVGSRKVLDIQLSLVQGEVQVEESNDGETWPPVYVHDSSYNAVINRCHASDGMASQEFKLRHVCTAERVRLKWRPFAVGARIKAHVLACNAACVAVASVPDDFEKSIPARVRGGFCRVMPISPAITLWPHYHFVVGLSLVGRDAQALARAHEEGLLRGELSVLLPGQMMRDIR